MHDEVFDVDALEVEEETQEPFRFSWAGETFVMPTAAMMDWRDQLGLETATAARSLELIMGPAEHDRFCEHTDAHPMTSARMGVVGDESRYTRAGWPIRTRPISPPGTNARR